MNSLTDLLPSLIRSIWWKILLTKTFDSIVCMNRVLILLRCYSTVLCSSSSSTMRNVRISILVVYFWKQISFSLSLQQWSYATMRTRQVLRCGCDTQTHFNLHIWNWVGLLWSSKIQIPGLCMWEKFDFYNWTNMPIFVGFPDLLSCLLHLPFLFCWTTTQHQ